jgi:hypothetical protein
MAILSIWLCFWNIQKIDLLTADIGRHVINGNIFLHSAEFGISKTQLLYTNLFSYTNPNFPFINHHWGSGIISYIIFSVFGWDGLSIVYIMLLTGGLVFSFLTAFRDAKLSVLFPVALFFTPLIAYRTEVRPEGLSYLFITLFLFLLFQCSHGRLSHKYLYIIPICELIWVNSHIYFIFGIFLTGVFLAEKLFVKTGKFFTEHQTKDSKKNLFYVFILTSAAAIISPYGFYGAVYPFLIFKNYGYRIVENQSIPFLLHLNFTEPSFLWYGLALIAVVISSIFVLKKQPDKFSPSLFFISLVFAVLAFLGIRNIVLFALVSLPFLAINISAIWENYRVKFDADGKIIAFMTAVMIITAGELLQFSSRLPWNRDFGIGLSGESLKSIEFIKEKNIRGPIFNNYDIGGAMIFGLFPREKVFVDNRPETYPTDFFNEIYIPMQENNLVWKKELSEYNFNAIYFYRLDYTPWSQKFLIDRVKDPDWSAVYVDKETIIFLRRNKENKDLISKYQLPAEIFNINR